MPFRPGMMLLINGLQSIQSNVGVDLGSGYVGVTQYGLYGAQVSAIINHMRGATVAQHVRTGRTAVL